MLFKSLQELVMQEIDVTIHHVRLQLLQPLIAKAVCWQVANDLQLDDADAFLQSDAGLEEVIAADADAKQRNVRSVPFFLIGAENLNNRHALSGAQQTDAYLAVFAKAAAEARAQAH